MIQFLENQEADTAKKPADARTALTIETFWHRDHGYFNSTKRDLSDLGEPYLSAAKEYRAMHSKITGSP